MQHGFCDCGFDSVVVDPAGAQVVNIGPHALNYKSNDSHQKFESSGTMSGIPIKGYNDEFPAQLAGILEPEVFAAIVNDVSLALAHCAFMPPSWRRLSCAHRISLRPEYRCAQPASCWCR